MGDDFHPQRRARLIPDRPLPAYTYVPGLTPRPAKELHPPPAPTGVSFDPTKWADCQGYLWGIDLFNHGYYWEAHEAWEALWHAAGRAGTPAVFFKGLIKLAASGVKELEGRPKGVDKHALRAASLLRMVAASHDDGLYMGLSLIELIDHAEAVAAGRIFPSRIHLLLATSSP